MVRTWFSYVVLGIGLMMLMASDKTYVAEDNKTSIHTSSFGTEKDIKVFINKAGSDNPTVNLVIDGKEINFDLPELAEGESKTFTTEDGTEVIVKSVSGNHMVWTAGEEINLPPLHFSGKHGHEGLATIISRVQDMTSMPSNLVTVSGADLPDDVVKAMVEAVQGVLTSYGVEKEVVFRKAPKFEFITKTEDVRGGGNYKIIHRGDVEMEFKTDTSIDGKKVMVIEKKVVTEDDDGSN